MSRQVFETCMTNVCTETLEMDYVHDQLQKLPKSAY